jgi:mannose-6-phosphate isomerase-like protein (cupin superfamily)
MSDEDIVAEYADIPEPLADLERAYHYAKEANRDGQAGADEGDTRPGGTIDGPVNLGAKLDQFADYWAPRTIAQLNDYDVMVVKVQGEFVWHQHDDTDDFFLVLKGCLTIQLPDRAVAVGPGELFIVPRGVQHRPVAEEETHVLLIEPRGTPNTGDQRTAAPRRLL